MLKLFALSALALLAIVVLRSGRVDPHRDLLERAWHERHPGPPLPTDCDDDLKIAYLEIDPSPGFELVIESDRLGLAMFSATGELLAFRDSAGCRERWTLGNQLGPTTWFAEGVVITEPASCGATRLTMLRREGDSFVTHARFKTRSCDSLEVRAIKPTWLGVELQVEIDRTTRTCTMARGWITGECAELTGK